MLYTLYYQRQMRRGRDREPWVMMDTGDDVGRMINRVFAMRLNQPLRWLVLDAGAPMPAPYCSVRPHAEGMRFPQSK